MGWSCRWGLEKECYWNSRHVPKIVSAQPPGQDPWNPCSAYPSSGKDPGSTPRPPPPLGHNREAIRVWCQVSWVQLPMAWGILRAGGGDPGRAECFPALGTTGANCTGCGATARLDKGAQKASTTPAKWQSRSVGPTPVMPRTVLAVVEQSGSLST